MLGEDIRSPSYFWMSSSSLKAALITSTPDPAELQHGATQGRAPSLEPRPCRILLRSPHSILQYHQSLGSVSWHLPTIQLVKGTLHAGNVALPLSTPVELYYTHSLPSSDSVHLASGYLRHTLHHLLSGPIGSTDFPLLIRKPLVHHQRAS